MANQVNPNRTKTQKKTDGAKFGVDDLTYDLVTILHEKSQALEAYAKYIEDAGEDDELRLLLERIRETDLRHVQELRDCLATVLGRGQKTM